MKLHKEASVRSSNRFKTLEEDFRKVHGNLYDYSKVEYKKAKDKVKIICKEHGIFEQNPCDHLYGKGCPLCANNKLKTTESFYEEALSIHGRLYDYSKVVYQGMHTKVKIICKEHGIFEQTPSNHLLGKGCSGCSKQGFKSNEPAQLYYIKLLHKGEIYYKVGVTSRTLQKRFLGSDWNKIIDYVEFKFDKGYDALSWEQTILKQYDEFKYKGEENFLIRGGNTELFTKNVLEYNFKH